MTVIISPLSQCASPEKRDTFLSHLEKIAVVTLATEPDCHAYAWFKSAGDNDSLPSHWLRGFEVYKNVEANQIDHRASTEYKSFRTAVGEERLLAKPSDLRFWHPTGIGFLTKQVQEIFAPREIGENLQYIVTDEFVPRQGTGNHVLEHLRKVATAAQEDEAVLSFWVQGRLDPSAASSEIGDDSSVYVLLRCQSQQAFNAFIAQASEWKLIDGMVENRKTSTWVESGIGFIGR